MPRRYPETRFTAKWGLNGGARLIASRTLAGRTHEEPDPRRDGGLALIPRAPCAPRVEGEIEGLVKTRRSRPSHGAFHRNAGPVAVPAAGYSLFENRSVRAVRSGRRSSLPRGLQGFCLRSERKETDVSVYKRGNVYWYEFWFRGQRIRESSGLTNKVAAQQAESIRKAGLAEGRAGIAGPKPIVNFGDFVRNEFLPWAEKQYQSHPRTYERYRESTKPLLTSLEKQRLDAVSMALVEKFKLSRSSEVSPATVNRDLAALRLILNLAIRKEYIAKNPVKEVQFLNEGPGHMRIVSHEEQQNYMAAASPLLRDVATLIVETGMRPEEVFTIRRENVHLNLGYLFVPSGKTHFARRNVPLTDATIHVLKQRTVDTESPFVFPRKGDHDKPLTTVRKAHHETLRAARIDPPFRLYDFRHTFGSRTAMAGVDLPTLKELMGHADISTTMRYVHPTPEHKQEAVRKLERYNRDQVFDLFEPELGSPQKSPQ